MTGREEEFRAHLLATFRHEADEHLRAIGALFTVLRSAESAEKVQSIERAFREVHTLKGAARSVGLARVEALCQAMESVLSKLRGEQIGLQAAVLEDLIAALDGVADLVAGESGRVDVAGLTDSLRRAAQTDSGADAPARPTPAAAAEAVAQPPAPRSDTVRLTTEKLDALAARAEELLGLKLAAGERVRQARDLLALLGDANGRSAVLDADRRHERRAAAGRLLRNLSADAHATATAVQGLLEEIRALRMIPAATIVFGFDRMVRDLARTRGKEVEWEVNGADLEVDRKVLEAVKDALLHLVRNAVDHGIELPDGRARAGKPRRGRVGLGFAALEGNRIEVRVTDDGGGMNAAKIRAAAVRAQLLTAEAAEQLDDAATFDLAQRSGLSTASMVTEISGRGLGLAIVKERVESLAGTVRVESRAGAGTTVQITLPTSVATFRGLLVETCRRNFLLGGNFVRAVVRIGSGGVGTIGGRQAIDYDGRTLAVADLADVLDLPRDGERREPDGKVCVVLRLGEDAGGFLVDAVVSEQEALVKDLHPPLVRVRHVAAAGLLGSGTSL